MVAPVRGLFNKRADGFELSKRFEKRFGSEASIDVMRFLFGHHDSPLAGCFEASAHQYLLKYLMHRALDDDERYERTAMADFLHEVRRQREENLQPYRKSHQILFEDMVIDTVEHALEHVIDDVDIKSWVPGRRRHHRIRRDSDLLPDTKITEDDIQEILNVDLPGNPPDLSNS